MSPNTKGCEADVSVRQSMPDAMSRGLHQATQPLSVLQGTLELALLSASTVDDFKHAIERSLEELQRVTESFDHLRVLAQLQQPTLDVATFAASSMVEDVLANLRAHAASAKIEFALQSKLDRNDSGQDRVRMSRSRVSAALKMALSDLLLRLKSGSSVLVSIESEVSSVLIRVEAVNPGHRESKLTETQSRLMTPRQELAREMTAICGGELTLNPYPYPSVLLMRLPKALLSSVCSEAEEQRRGNSCLV